MTFSYRNLFDKVLMDGIENGCDELCVVAGYASPSMISRLYLESKKKTSGFRLRLIVGMTGTDGIGEDSHRRFTDLIENPPAGCTGLTVQYVRRSISVHSKLYIWWRMGEKHSAWMGSANFTQNGFGIGRRGEDHHEIMQSTNFDEAVKYFNKIEAASIVANHPELENDVIVRVENYRSDLHADELPPQNEEEDDAVHFADAIVLPLVKLRNPGKGQVHDKSGLNWGQRPEYGREPNQAYIPVPAKVSKTGFFPPADVVFRVTTTDGKLFLMRVAQEGDKALETPDNNSYIGEYFRRRLGVANGAMVTQNDLLNFGSRFVAFHKLDDGVDDPAFVLEYSPRCEAFGRKFYEL